jgi:hypothetical protein
MNVFLVDSRTFRESPGAFAISLPASSEDPTVLTGHLLRIYLPLATSLTPLERPANCNGSAAKKKGENVRLYKKFRSTMPSAARTAMMIGWWIR